MSGLDKILNDRLLAVIAQSLVTIHIIHIIIG
jgi:hypothetical protein